jgi:tetratricopeptide (TPR) repeat protein
MVRVRTFIIYLIISIGVTGSITAYVMTELKLKPCQIEMQQYQEKLRAMERANRMLTAKAQAPQAPKPPGPETKKTQPVTPPAVSETKPPAQPSKTTPSRPGKAYAKQSATKKQHPALSRGCGDIGRDPLNRGEYQRAITLYSHAITKNPRDRLCHRWLGDAYFGLGDKERAVTEWKKAAQLGDKTIQSYLDYLKLD